MKKMMLKFKFSFVPFVFIFIIILIIGFTIFYVNKQQADGLTINIAGRQRMLNQRHFKEILLEKSHFDISCLKTRAVFNESLEALLNGGKTSLGNLPPAPTEEIRQVLNKNKILM